MIKIKYKTLSKEVELEFGDSSNLRSFVFEMTTCPMTADVLSRILGVNVRLIRGVTKEAEKQLNS